MQVKAGRSGSTERHHVSDYLSRVRRSLVLAVTVLALVLGMSSLSSAAPAAGPTITLNSLTPTQPSAIIPNYCIWAYHVTISGIKGSKSWSAFAYIDGSAVSSLGPVTKADNGHEITLTPVVVNGLTLNDGASHTFSVSLQSGGHQTVTSASNELSASST